MSENIRILLADDHADQRAMLRGYIAAEAGMEVCGEAADVDAAVRLFDLLQPDVALLDIQMAGRDGISIITAIMGHHPQRRVLALTSFAEDERVYPAIQAGAMGYLLKDAAAEELALAIRDACHGEVWLDSFLARKVLQEINRPQTGTPTPRPLTRLEREALELLARGVAGDEVSEELGVSEDEVREYRRSILAKLHLAHRSGVALYALRAGKSPEGAG